MKFVDRVRASVADNGLTISTRDLTVVCDRTTTALRDVSIEVPPGSFIGIVGVNGSGKSTLANVLLGLGGRSLEVSGVVTYNGMNIYGKAVSDRTRTVLRSLLFSYVPKVPSLEPGLTVEQNILRPFRLSGRAVDRDLLGELLEDFELSDDLGRRTRELSSGFQQRANIVRGLLASVPAIVLDEPTDALDPAQKDLVLARLARHAAGRTVLVVSHERTGAPSAIRLHGGRLMNEVS